MQLDEARLRELHTGWLNGRTKNDIERREMNYPRSHGQEISRQWRAIGLETVREHPMVTEVHRLRGILDLNGIEY